MGNRTSSSNRQDNLQPNHLPATISLDVFEGGKPLGTIEIPQASKRSEKGNISFSGGIKSSAGWKLEGHPFEVLGNLTFKVNGVDLAMASSKVHRSEKGNPTVCNTAVIDIPDAIKAAAAVKPEDETTTRFMVQVYATYMEAKEAYALSVSGFVTGTPVSGPPVVGTIAGNFQLANVG